MTDMRTELVADAAREALAHIPHVDLLHVLGSDDDHPLRTRKAGTYRIVASGWAPSLHRSAVHMVVDTRADREDDVLRRRMPDKLATMMRRQESRARSAGRILHVDQPVERHPFEDDGADIDVEHVVTDAATIAVLRHEEGDDGAVRRRIARAVNRHLRHGEGLATKPLAEVTMDRWVLRMPLALGARATLDGDLLFLQDRLPETVATALGALEGRPLSTIVAAAGMDHMTIRTIADGQVFGGDARAYARNSATVIDLLGNTPGRVRDLM
jgi:hypothetical protein